jgi:hypothetical protein
MSRLSDFLSGALVPKEVVLSAPPPMSAAEWRGRFRQALVEERAALLHGEQVARRLAELREMAAARGDLRRVMAEEEDAARPTPMPDRVPEAMVRVKVVQGFSTEWRGIPYYGPEGSIVDVPKGLARAASQLFEVLDDQTTPLYLVQPTPERPR